MPRPTSHHLDDALRPYGGSETGPRRCGRRRAGADAEVPSSQAPPRAPGAARPPGRRLAPRPGWRRGSLAATGPNRPESFRSSWSRSRRSAAAKWVIQQLRAAFPFDTAPRHLIFDRDSIFSSRCTNHLFLNVQQSRFRSEGGGHRSQGRSPSARRGLIADSSRGTGDARRRGQCGTAPVDDGYTLRVSVAEDQRGNGSYARGVGLGEAVRVVQADGAQGDRT